MEQRQELLARLVAMQYERNDIDFARGIFRARGEIIDIFPAEHAELAVRVTMFDEIPVRRTDALLNTESVVS